MIGRFSPGKEDDLIVADESLIQVVIEAAVEVHRELGTGLLERPYLLALALVLSRRGISVKIEEPIPAVFQGHDLGVGYRADMIVEGQLLIELKAVDSTLPIHISQVVTYLKMLRFKRGYVLNFGARLMKEGIRRVSI
ncbi:MAG: GxxExxY protein [Planctomycetota bacterium]